MSPSPSRSARIGSRLSRSRPRYGRRGSARRRSARRAARRQVERQRRREPALEPVDRRAGRERHQAIERGALDAELELAAPPRPTSARRRRCAPARAARAASVSRPSLQRPSSRRLPPSPTAAPATLGARISPRARRRARRAAAVRASRAAAREPPLGSARQRRASRSSRAPRRGSRARRRRSAAPARLDSPASAASVARELEPVAVPAELAVEPPQLDAGDDGSVTVASCRPVRRRAAAGAIVPGPARRSAARPAARARRSRPATPPRAGAGRAPAAAAPGAASANGSRRRARVAPPGLEPRSSGLDLPARRRSRCRRGAVGEQSGRLDRGAGELDVDREAPRRERRSDRRPRRCRRRQPELARVRNGNSPTRSPRSSLATRGRSARTARRGRSVARGHLLARRASSIAGSSTRPPVNRNSRAARRRRLRARLVAGTDQELAAALAARRVAQVELVAERPETPPASPAIGTAKCASTRRARRPRRQVEPAG